MRKIKFRGKCIETNTWVYGAYDPGTFPNIFNILIPLFPEGRKVSVPHRIFRVYEESVGQFTGCKDMNGIEIYEGDYISDIDRVLITIYKVWYSEENACFMITMVKPDNDVENMMGNYDIEHHFKVIGNTFDNKELKESEE